MRNGAFTVIPAIDIKGGCCVRLWQGEMDRATIYAEHPEAVARRWEAGGASLIHVVDLDGAVEGRTANLETIGRIVAAVAVPVELGGGIRDRETMQAYHQLGVKRLVLGTAAAREPAMLGKLLEGFPGEVWIGIDARDGFVAVEGWRETLPLTAVEVARGAEAAGASGIIYTDISRDGTLVGPNIEATRALLSETSLPVVASGGVAVLGDIERLATLADEGLAGVIVGRALYTGAVALEDALRLERPPRRA